VREGQGHAGSTPATSILRPSGYEWRSHSLTGEKCPSKLAERRTDLAFHGLAILKKAEARAHFPAIMAFVHDADLNWRNPRRTGRVSPLDTESFLIHGAATSKPRPLPCAFYRTVAGNEPVREKT
jgi:hypothetical protein